MLQNIITKIEFHSVKGISNKQANTSDRLCFTTCFKCCDERFSLCNSCCNGRQRKRSPVTFLVIPHFCHPYTVDISCIFRDNITETSWHIVSAFDQDGNQFISLPGH